MKKLLSMVLCAALLMTMSGCSNGSDEASEQIERQTDYIKSDITVEETTNASDPKEIFNVFPDIDSFETEMNKAITNYMNQLGLDQSMAEWAVTDLKIEDAPEDSPFDKTFSCTYGFLGFQVIGNIKDNKIVVMAIGFLDGFSDKNKDQYAALLTWLMIPTSLFDEQYNDFEKLLELCHNILDEGTKNSENNVESCVLYVDDIEYTIERNDGASLFYINTHRLWDKKSKEYEDLLLGNNS